MKSVYSTVSILVKVLVALSCPLSSVAISSNLSSGSPSLSFKLVKVSSPNLIPATSSYIIKISKVYCRPNVKNSETDKLRCS